MTISEVFTALGDRTRLRAALMLRAMELTVTELTVLLGVAQSTTSGVLRVLVGAGVVDATRVGRHAYYRMPCQSPWLEQALEGTTLDPSDEAALERLRSARLEADPDEAAMAFDRAWVPGRSWKALARSLLYLTDLGITADFGVGSGELTVMLARSSTRLHAVDRSEKALEGLATRAAAAGVGNIVTQLQDMTTVQLPEPVDLVAISLSLSEVAAPDAVLARAFEALRPGGRVWVTELEKHFTRDGLAGALRAGAFRDIHIQTGARSKKPPRDRSLIAFARKPTGDSP